jgi:hypothetical protein
MQIKIILNIPLFDILLYSTIYYFKINIFINVYKGSQLTVTLRFRSSSAVWQWTLLGLLGQNIKCKHSNIFFCNT